jgi:hypothetical protein
MKLPSGLALKDEAGNKNTPPEKRRYRSGAGRKHPIPIKVPMFV